MTTAWMVYPLIGTPGQHTDADTCIHSHTDTCTQVPTCKHPLACHHIAFLSPTHSDSLIICLGGRPCTRHSYSSAGLPISPASLEQTSQCCTSAVMSLSRLAPVLTRSLKADLKWHDMSTVERPLDRYETDRRRRQPANQQTRTSEHQNTHTHTHTHTYTNTYRRAYNRVKTGGPALDRTVVDSKALSDGQSRPACQVVGEHTFMLNELSSATVNEMHVRDRADVYPTRIHSARASRDKLIYKRAIKSCFTLTLTLTFTLSLSLSLSLSLVNPDR
ncbi:unnamed protein product [Protopolystoma xenopodis]|uniref:Uncharacterized protein n=1 Tax=Protopolystoma xenopodis TaxID=117903 RepID=A0A448X1A9_9PLAT|nr:unnamed protein product [Protopolystoma xenopodis]